MAYRDALTSLLTKFLIRTPSLDEITPGIDACLDELRHAAPADHLVPVELDDAWRTATGRLRAASDLAAATLQ